MNGSYKINTQVNNVLNQDYIPRFHFFMLLLKLYTPLP